MAAEVEIAFNGYADLVTQMENQLARMVKSGIATKVRFSDANGSMHEYRDIYEIERALSILRAKADEETNPGNRGRRCISLVSQR